MISSLDSICGTSETFHLGDGQIESVGLASVSSVRVCVGRDMFTNLVYIRLDSESSSCQLINATIRMKIERNKIFYLEELR